MRKPGEKMSDEDRMAKPTKETVYDIKRKIRVDYGGQSDWEEVCRKKFVKFIKSLPEDKANAFTNEQLNIIAKFIVMDRKDLRDGIAARIEDDLNELIRRADAMDVLINGNKSSTVQKLRKA